MNAVSIGDLAQSFLLRQDNLRIRGDLMRLSGELSSGVKADVTSAVSGDFGPLSSIEGSIARLGAFGLAAREAALTLTGAQQALDLVQTSMTDLSGPLLMALGSEQPSLVDTAAADARVRFASVVATLNTQIADRSLFAGAAIDGPALAAPDTILDGVMAAIAGATTAEDVGLAIRAWFDPGGGFDSAGYLGSTAPAAPVPVADGEAVDQPVTATDGALRRTLAAFAMAAVLDRGALAGQQAERAALANAAGEELLSAERGVVELRTSLGAREDQVDRARARTEAGLAALDLARSEIVSADPFETATRLKAAEAQLDALYTLTARLSRLTLTEYLR